MRILMVGHYPPHGGGVSRHLDNLVRKLRENHEVHVLTYGPVKVREFERDLVHQLRVPPVYGLRGTTFALAGARKIIELHRKFNFDLIHCHFAGTTSFAGALAKDRTGLPLVVTVHGSDLENTPKSPLGRFYVEGSLRKADAVVAVSHHLARLARLFGAENVEVIPNGIQEFGKPSGRREFITFIGALQEYKSPETFLKLAEFFPDFKFLVVGDGPLRKKLESKAPQNVSFLGYRRDVGNILGRSLLLVLPSRREGFGLVILEANSLRVPVVGRRVSAIPELIREGKNGLTFGNFDELVEKVGTLLESPKTIRRMGAIGGEVAKRYSWAEVAKKVEKVYFSIKGGGENDDSDQHAGWPG